MIDTGYADRLAAWEARMRSQTCPHCGANHWDNKPGSTHCGACHKHRYTGHTGGDWIAAFVADAPPLSPETQQRVATLLNVERFTARNRESYQPHPASSPPPLGLSRRKLARGKTEITNNKFLQEYRQSWDEGLARTPLFSLWYGAPEDIFRWRIEFDCGCIEDRCTSSDDPQSLLDAQQQNPYVYRDGKEKLPPGEYLCHGEHPQQDDLPLREVTSWDEYIGEKVIPADPVAPPDWWVEMDRELALAIRWEDHRRANPKTIVEWTATLTCGHGMKTAKPLDWTPKQGVVRSPEKAARLRERNAEDGFEPNGWLSKVIAAECPDDGHGMDCGLCPIVRRPVAYQPLGWLVERKASKPPRKVKSPEELLQARLRKAEHEVAQIRAEIKRLQE